MQSFLWKLKCKAWYPSAVVENWTSWLCFRLHFCFVIWQHTDNCFDISRHLWIYLCPIICDITQLTASGFTNLSSKIAAGKWENWNYWIVLSILNWFFFAEMVHKHVRFIARTVLVKDNNIEQACGILNRIMGKEDLLDQFRRTRYYEKPTQVRRRINYERCKAFYNEDMQRKIQMVLRKNRTDPFPGCNWSLQFS